MQEIGPAPHAKIGGKPHNHPGQGKPAEHRKGCWSGRHGAAEARLGYHILLRRYRRAVGPEADRRGGSAVTECRPKRSRTGHESAATASNLFATAVEKYAIGDVQALGTANDLATSKKMAARDGAEEIKLERRREDEKIGDAGLHGEKRRIVESLEVDRAVDGLRGMMKILPDGEFKFGAALFRNGEAGPEPFVDGSGVVHPDQRFEVSRGHGFVVQKLLRFGKTEVAKATESYTKRIEKNRKTNLDR